MFQKSSGDRQGVCIANRRAWMSPKIHRVSNKAYFDFIQDPRNSTK